VNYTDDIFMDGDDIYLQNSYNQAGHLDGYIELYRLDMEHQKMIKVADTDDSSCRLLDADLDERQ
jgi:hypothetical protein